MIFKSSQQLIFLQVYLVQIFGDFLPLPPPSQIFGDFWAVFKNILLREKYLWATFGKNLATFITTYGPTALFFDYQHVLLESQSEKRLHRWTTV